VPIPGTTKLHRLQENLGAVAVELTASDLQEIYSAVSKITVQGDRLPESVLKMTGLWGGVKGEWQPTSDMKWYGLNGGRRGTQLKFLNGSFLFSKPPKDFCLSSGRFGSVAASRSGRLSDRLEPGAASQTVSAKKSAANVRISLQDALQIFQATGSARPRAVVRKIRNRKAANGAVPDSRIGHLISTLGWSWGSTKSPLRATFQLEEKPLKQTTFPSASAALRRRPRNAASVGNAYCQELSDRPRRANRVGGDD
jgi:hypothetical protein